MALVRARGAVAVERRPLVSNEGEAVVQFRRALIDGLDVEAAAGLGDFEGVLGRSAVGVVESVQGARGRALLRRRVVAAPVVACGECDICRGGAAAQCRRATILGLQGRDGCLAERFAAPISSLAPIPDDVDDDHAAFAPLVATCLHTALRLKPPRDSYVTVLGDGRLGLMMVQLLRREVETVRLVGRRLETLSLAERWGAKHRHVDDVGRRRDQDVVIDCTGSPDGPATAMELVRPRGTVVLKSMSRDEATAEATALFWRTATAREVSVIGGGIGVTGDDGLMRWALSLLRRREVDAATLISRRIGLAESATAIRTASQPGVLGVLVS